MIRQVYVAGSYSAGTLSATLRHISRALDAALVLARAGYFPIVPHVSGSHRNTWAHAMEGCRAMIQTMDPSRDALVLLPGWERSRGATEERELALRLGMSVVTLDQAIREVQP